MLLKILAFTAFVVFFAVLCAAADISPVITFIVLYALSGIFFDHLDR